MSPRSVRARVGAVVALLVVGAGCGPEPPRITRSAAAVIETLLHHRCPATDPGRAVNLPWFAGDLVVVDDPTVLVACRYPGLRRPGAPPHAVVRRVVTDRAVVASWRAQLNALPPVQKGVYNCGNDNGSSVLVAFLHGDDFSVVRFKLSGCAWAGNGQVLRDATGSVLTRLVKLVS